MANVCSFKIKTKILIGFASVLICTVILGGVSLMQISAVDREGDMMATNLLPSVVRLGEMNNAVGTARRSELQALTSNAQELDKYETRFAKNSEEFNAAIESYTKLELTTEEKKQASALRTLKDTYFQQAKQTFTMCREGRQVEATKFLRDVSKKDYDACMKMMGDLITYNGKEADQGKIKIASAYSSAIRWVIVLLVFAIGIGAVMGTLIARCISKPVNILSVAAGRVAEGDLNVSISKTSNDEIGDLTLKFSHMVDNLRNLIGKMAETSSLVASASHQLIATSEQISEGAGDVASQAGTVATAAEEMSATSGDIAQNCQMAAEGSHRASSAASSGAEVVNSTVQVMGRIASRVQETAKTVESLGARSDQIGEIIGTIQDIADQTNLLALNAAIEAARAGEQGRGFAVVADEVRALAERTTKATREIGDMIKAIQNETKSAVLAMEEGVVEVERGTEEAGKSGRALEDILEQINSVTMQINQVATAAEEQTATTSEISGNIQNINDIMQSTVRGAQESSSAANRLSQQAEELQRLVGQFKL